MPKHRLTKATDISPKVKAIVAERDSPRGYIQCVICGSNQAQPNAHYIRRSQGGLGIEENILSLCPKCHREFDNSGKNTEQGKYYRQRLEQYLKSHYPNWTREMCIYKKGM